jgi:penicillin-binding protein 1A
MFNMYYQEIETKSQAQSFYALCTLDVYFFAIIRLTMMNKLHTYLKYLFEKIRIALTNLKIPQRLSALSQRFKLFINRLKSPSKLIDYSRSLVEKIQHAIASIKFPQQLTEFFKRVKLKQPSNAKVKVDQVKSPLWKKILVGFTLTMMVSGSTIGAAGLYYLYTVIQDAPELNPYDFIALDSSKIFDQNDEFVADVGYQIRENISFEVLPQVTIDAFVAVEDSRFFEHNGFDIPRFIKVIFENIRRGSFAQGASTFTMQLVKSTYFETNDTLAPRQGLEGINRKIQEIYLALQAEEYISKERILELYLNRINFGVPNNKRGIQTAAQYYFNKDVTELGLLESAMLAGVINAPNFFQPIRNIDRATSRTHVVIDLMLYHGYITQEEARLAKATPLQNILVGTLPQAQVLENVAPSQAYVDAVVKEVIRLTGFNPVDVPMRIYTHLNPELQSQVELILDGQVADVPWPNDIIQGAIVSVDNRTGAVLAIGGGRNYTGERLFNRVTDMRRQPGSAAKLILTYPLAFEHLNWSTQHALLDRPIIYAGTDVVIRNFDRVYRGVVSLARAVGVSLNIPAIDTMQAVVSSIGSRAVVSYLNRIGFPQVQVNQFDLGYGIGGSTFTVSPLQLAGAYSAMLNEGLYISPHTVRRIEFLDGRESIEPVFEADQVLSIEAAYLTANMMEQNVTGPYRNFMQLLRRPYEVYAKTGTSDWGETGLIYNIPAGSAKDKWMAAGTRDITHIVWVGYDRADPDQISYVDRVQNNLNLPGRINNVLITASERIFGRPSNIVRPPGVVDITIVPGLFPYQVPTEFTDPTYAWSGLIKQSATQYPTLMVPFALDMPFTITNGASFTGFLMGYSPYNGYKYFTIVDYPSHGELIGFDPESGYIEYVHYGDEQADQFTVILSNGERDSNLATISIFIQP